MKKIIFWVIVVIVIVGIIYFFLPKTASYNSSSSSNITAENQTSTSTISIVSPVVTSTTTSSNVVSPKTYSVSIVNFSFNPSTLNINKGDTVIWTNNDGVPHQIVGGNLGGPVMSKGSTYTFTFNEIGTVNYHCAIHPSMKGIIIVK